MTGNNLRWHSCSNMDFPLKRTKVSRACETCRSKKIKCDGLNPCQRCDSNNIACEYTEKTSRKRFKKEEPSSSTTYIIDNATSFKNEFYQQLSNKSGSSLLPLLFDFFNTTSQPMHIWNNMIKIHDQQRTDSLLFQEVFHLFMSHNTLYSAFIDSRLIACVLHYPQFMQNPTPSTILVHSILSVTFYSAYQSLLPSNDAMYTLAHLFYKKAHKAFIEACFPTQLQPEFSKQEKLYLVQSSVLLAHFQCQAIHENQAYTTIRFGLDLTQRYAIVDLASKHRKLAIFLKVLDAWHVWLSLYLNRPYSNKELDVLSLDTAMELSKEQAWSIRVTEVYTELLRKVLQKQLMTLTSIKENLKLASDTLSSIVVNYNKKTVKNPIKTIQLYHNTLTIQLLTCPFHQVMDHYYCAELVDSSTSSSLSSQATTITTEDFAQKDLPKEDIAVIVESCTQSSQNILTAVNHPHITMFLPILYSICQVSRLCTHHESRQQLAFYSQLLTVLKNASLHLEAYQFLYNKLNTTITADVGLVQQEQQQQQDLNHLIGLSMDDLFAGTGQQKRIYNNGDNELIYYPTMKNEEDLYWVLDDKRLLPQPTKKPTTAPGSTIFFASEVQTLHLSSESFPIGLDMDNVFTRPG